MADSPVLVTDGEQRAALAVVRSLGRAGFTTYVCSTRRRSLAGASRYAAGAARVESPLTDPEGFVAGVSELARLWRAAAVIPVSDASACAILPHRERFAHAIIPFPSLNQFRRVSDKNELLAAARSLGFAVPEQRVVRWRGEGVAEVEELGFPIVIKPSRSVTTLGTQRLKLGIGYAITCDDLREQLSTLPTSAYPVLLQRRIVGPGVGVFLLIWNGEVLGVFSHRRIREKPPSGGVSVYRESIPADPDLVERSRALLALFNWEGVAMVEYKVEAATGTPYLMEVNPRFWGSLQLAVDAGVDFPVLLVSAALGRSPRPVSRYRTGLRSRWWAGDVDHLLARLRRSPEALRLAPDAPTRVSALRDFLKLWRRGDRNEIFRLEDPGPVVRETIDWFLAH